MNKPSFNKLQVGIGIAVFLFSLLSYDDNYARWWYLSLFMGVCVLALQFTKFPLLRVYALWFGLFLVAQAILSLIVIDRNYRTLFANLNYEKNFTNYQGVSGIQHITTDTKGFRTTKPVNYQHDSPMRIYAIGGSTTEQMIIDDRFTFTHLLQHDLQKMLGTDVEVVNTGVSGLRTTNHIATVKHIEDLHPDLIMIMLGVNDWNRQIHMQFPEDIPKKVINNSWPDWQTGIRLRNTLLGQLIVAIQTPDIAQDIEEQAAMGGSSFQAKNSLNRQDVRSFRPESVSDEYRKNLNTLVNLCKQSSAPCLFVTQPNAYKASASTEIKKTFWMTPPYAKYTLDFDSMVHIAKLYNKYLIELANTESISICDIDSGMPPTFNSFYDDVHFNIPGARRVADLLRPCILDIMGPGS